MLYISEIVIKNIRLSSKPVIISEQGIFLYFYLWERIYNNSGLINWKDIRKIVVVRKNVIQYLSNNKVIHWKAAPVEFIVYTKFLRKHRSGRRHPKVVLELTNAISKERGIPIIDNGEGLGESYVSDI